MYRTPLILIASWLPLLAGCLESTRDDDEASQSTPVDVSDADDDGPCGGVSYQGCCSGDVLFFCEDDAVQTSNCDADGETCGWYEDEGYYDCGDADELDVSDPSGEHDRACQ